METPFYPDDPDEPDEQDEPKPQFDTIHKKEAELKEENILFNEDLFRDVGHLIPIEEIMLEENTTLNKIIETEIINVQSDFHTIELAKIPPKVPYYDTILIMHIKTKLTLIQITELLVKGFNHYSISYNKNEDHKCGLECYAISNSAVINFIVSIYLSDDETEHIVEFRHWSGCRYEYGNIILNLTEYIGLNIITGWSPLVSKPPLYADLETSCEIPEIEIDTLLDMLEISCLSDLEYHLTRLHSMILSNPSYFEKNGKGTEFIDMLFVLYKKHFEYKNYKILIYDSLCMLTKIIKLDNKYIDKILELILSSLIDSDQHIIESSLFGLSNIINMKGPIQLTEKQKLYITQYSTYTKTSIATNATNILSKL